jgi:hypothetical protein
LREHPLLTERSLRNQTGCWMADPRSKSQASEHNKQVKSRVVDHNSCKGPCARLRSHNTHDTPTNHEVRRADAHMFDCCDLKKKSKKTVQKWRGCLGFLTLELHCDVFNFSILVRDDGLYSLYCADCGLPSAHAKNPAAYREISVVI